MSKLAKAVLVLFLALLAVPAHADGKQAPARKIGPVSRAIGNYFARSAQRSIQGSERMINKGEAAQNSTIPVLKKAGGVLAWFGAVRGVYGLTKGAIADGLLGQENVNSWTKD